MPFFDTSIPSVILADRWDRDFRDIVSGGWANESDGNVESPTGHFAKVSIATNELTELRDAFDWEPLTMQVHTDGSVTYNGFGWVGFFLVIENHDGLAWVYAFRNQRDLDRVFEDMSGSYGNWAV